MQKAFSMNIPYANIGTFSNLYDTDVQVLLVDSAPLRRPTFRVPGVGAGTCLQEELHNIGFTAWYRKMEKSIELIDGKSCTVFSFRVLQHFPQRCQVSPFHGQISLRRCEENPPAWASSLHDL
jgi:hypothetical protein